MAKLGTRGRAQLVALVHQHHLVDPPGQAECR
jgi:DNA-binding CsgD family transcriptional regulator